MCASIGAWRAASALIRLTLEKTLRVNGYVERELEKRINSAAQDGIITDSRRRRAHADVRVLGNDVLHDDWRQITEDEVMPALHYVQRILEDFYDDRATVTRILNDKGRLTD